MKMQSLVICVSLTASLVASTATATEPRQHAESDLSMPTSMKEFIEHHIDADDFGIWMKRGVTQEMWAGLPSGLKYTERSETRLSDDGTYILDSYMMTTDDGKVISTGSGITYWDDKIGQPVSASSGFDMGKPYSGSGMLQGIDRSTTVWKYTETSRGATTDYLVTTIRSGANDRTVSVKKADGSGTTWKSTSMRVNGLKEALAGHDPSGTWDMALPDGDTLRSVVTWGPGERVLIERAISIGKGGTSKEIAMGLTFWDPAEATICKNWFTQDGKVFEGRVISSTNKDGKLTMTTSIEGVSSTGDVLTAQNTRTSDDDTQTTTWSDVSINGHQMNLSWVNVPMVAKRADKKK